MTPFIGSSFFLLHWLRSSRHLFYRSEAIQLYGLSKIEFNKSAFLSKSFERNFNSANPKRFWKQTICQRRRSTVHSFPIENSYKNGALKSQAERFEK